MILGKPYAGKLHVRFDEGEEEDKAKKMWLDPLPLAFFFSTLPGKKTTTNFSNYIATN
jgi:hypothetical protein